VTASLLLLPRLYGKITTRRVFKDHICLIAHATPLIIDLTHSGVMTLLLISLYISNEAFA